MTRASGIGRGGHSKPTSRPRKRSARRRMRRPVHGPIARARRPYCRSHRPARSAMPTACAPTEPVRRRPPGSTGGASAPLERRSLHVHGRAAESTASLGARLAVSPSIADVARPPPPDLRRDHRRRRVAARRPAVHAAGRRRRRPRAAARTRASRSTAASTLVDPDETVGADVVAGPIDGYLDRDIMSFRPVTLPNSVDTNPQAEQSTVDPGLVHDDGTLLTGLRARPPRSRTAPTSSSATRSSPATRWSRSRTTSTSR